MITLNEVTRICPGCGKPFTLAQEDFDVMLNRSMTNPIYCSNGCACDGWDPSAVRFAAYRRQMRANEK